MKTYLKALKLRIEVLEAELATCNTVAEHRSVAQSLDAAWRRYEAAKGGGR